MRDAVGTNRRLNPEGGDTPVWSADATRIVVARRHEGVVNMFEQAADGSGREVRLLAAERNTTPNDWSARRPLDDLHASQSGHRP